jgi:hypothetical protein
MKQGTPVGQINDGGELSKQQGNGEAGTLTGAIAVNSGEWCSGGQRQLNETLHHWVRERNLR